MVLQGGSDCSLVHWWLPQIGAPESLNFGNGPFVEAGRLSHPEFRLWAGLTSPAPPPPTRHIFWQYRQEHPGTNVGEPPPDGLPGFNSGVLLLDLEAMRQSERYNRLLEPAVVQQLASKFHFKGHLGDQDFFTLVGMEHPELFYILDCTWNRQLCTWWRDHGYSDVFEHYFRCDGHVRIYHGNCNTPIPVE